MNMRHLQSSEPETARLCARRPRTLGAPRRGDLLENRFRVEGQIAGGTHSVVYAATNIVTDKAIAIKWPRRIKAFGSVVREARLAARVQHPAVLDIYDIGQHDGVFFLTMECVRGATLGTRIASGAIDYHEFVAVFEAILSAVKVLHASGVVHCDLKPSNILLTVDDEGRLLRPKLIDFGSATLLNYPASTDFEVSARFSRQGSEPYMPREQRQGCASIDERVDIHALGVVLDRCTRTWRARSIPGSSRMSRLREVIGRATASEPARRFENVSEFARALRIATTPITAQVTPRKLRSTCS